MFSKLSSDRFKQSKAMSAVGPGSYDLPPTLDDHGVILRSGSERFLELATEPMDENIRMHEDAVDPPKLQIPTPRTARKPLQGLQGKENSSAILNSARGPKEEGEGPAKNRRMSSVDPGRGDLAIAKKAAANAQALMRTKELEAEELKKQVEELTASNKEWQRRANDLEGDRRFKAQALQHHENAIAGLQRTLEQTKAQVDAQKQQIEEMRRAAPGAGSPTWQGGPEEALAKEGRLERASQEIEEARRAAELQVRRVAAREAAVKEALAEALARERSRVDSVEQSVAAGAERVASVLQEVEEQQERLHEHVRKKMSEAKRREHRARKLERDLRAKSVVQQASLGAALALWSQEGKARCQAEELARLSEGNIDHEVTELFRARGAAETEARRLRSEVEALRAAVGAAQSEAAAAAAVPDALRERLQDAAARGAQASHWQGRAEAAEAKSKACALLMKENALLQADNDRLKGAEAALQAELERTKERQAELAGHSNHRQKIRATMSMKEENLALHAGLKKARQEAFRLEQELGQREAAPSAATAESPSPPSPL